MHRASSSSSSSSSSRRSRRRPLTREQLLKSLEILGPHSHPLPSELPPSPPASRESSPVPGTKRRHEPDPEPLTTKKPRRSSSSSHPHLPSRPVPIPSSSRHEPCEDGEVKEESSESHSSTPIASSTDFPVRRPRRGVLPAAEWDSIYEKCFAIGRKLKYSAYARVAAAHPTTSKDYKALRVPLDPNSPYAKCSLLLARLELMDSLLHFIYALWGKENSVRTCFRASWRTVEEAISRTEAKWQAESRDDREKAFLGLIQYIHAFIHGRKLRYRMNEVDRENDAKLQRLKLQWDMDQKKAQAAAAAPIPPSSATLPSPSTTNSSNSTPLGGHASPSVPPSVPPPRPKEVMTLPPPHVTYHVNAQYVWENKSQSGGIRASLDRINSSQTTLSIPILAKHFPRTFARVVYTSLSPSDEHEPDYQDDECELYWPQQVITGEGLGWACLVGMSMVKEFGRDFGYEGVNGVIPRLPGDQNLGHADPRFDPHTR